MWSEEAWWYKIRLEKYNFVKFCLIFGRWKCEQIFFFKFLNFFTFQNLQNTPSTLAWAHESPQKGAFFFTKFESTSEKFNQIETFSQMDGILSSAKYFNAIFGSISCTWRKNYIEQKADIESKTNFSLYWKYILKLA